MKIGLSNQHRRDSFTLVEVLVALAIFSIILVFLGVIITSVSSVSSIGRQNSENSGNARAILDLMSEELEAGVSRPDLNQTNWIALTDSGSSLTFYSRSTGSPPSSGTPPVASAYRPLSFVEYMFNQTGTNSFLERGDQAVLWSDTPPTSLPLGYVNPNLPAPTPGLVLDGVVAFQVTFLQNDGTLSFVYSSTSTVAVAVSLGVVDSNSLKLLLNSGKLPSLSKALAKAATGSIDPKQSWENEINTSAVLSAYPQQVRSGLQFFERIVDLPRPAL